MKRGKQLSIHENVDLDVDKLIYIMYKLYEINNVQLKAFFAF